MVPEEVCKNVPNNNAKWFQRKNAKMFQNPLQKKSATTFLGRFAKMFPDKSKVANLSGTMILNDAYTEMLEWDEYYQLPETLVMDAKRIYTLRIQVDRVAVGTAIMMICQANFPQTPFMQILRRSSSLKQTMEKNIDILLEDF